MMTKAYVISVRSPIAEEMVTVLAASDEHRAFLRNPETKEGSCIVDPRGVLVAGPTAAEDTILYADIDLGLCVQQKLKHDMAGHYNRPDIFTLQVNETRPSLYAHCASPDKTMPTLDLTHVETADGGHTRHDATTLC
jgi:aliphatic nitrilase